MRKTNSDDSTDEQVYQSLPAYDDSFEYFQTSPEKKALNKSISLWGRNSVKRKLFTQSDDHRRLFHGTWLGEGSVLEQNKTKLSKHSSLQFFSSNNKRTDVSIKKDTSSPGFAIPKDLLQLFARLLDMPALAEFAYAHPRHIGPSLHALQEKKGEGLLTFLFDVEHETLHFALKQVVLFLNREAAIVCTSSSVIEQLTENIHHIAHFSSYSAFHHLRPVDHPTGLRRRNACANLNESTIMLDHTGVSIFLTSLAVYYCTQEKPFPQSGLQRWVHLFNDDLVEKARILTVFDRYTEFLTEKIQTLEADEHLFQKLSI